MSKIVGIYLAAGQSSRMGQNKLLLPLGEKTLGLHALHSALQSDLDHIIVVLKDENQSFNDLKNNITVVTCPESSKGLSYSIKYGIQFAKKFDPDGAMILLADQPFICDKMINQLIDTFQSEKVSYVASRYKKIIRPPLLIGKQVFPLIQQLNADEGIKKLLMENRSLEGKIIDFEDEELFLDIDTLEEYEEIIKKYSF